SFGNVKKFLMFVKLITSITLPNEVFCLMLTPSELAVLSYLVRCSDDTGICYPSIHTIATACAMSDNTVRKCVRKLEDREIISKSGGFRASKFGKEQNTSFIYELNPNFYNEGFARANLVDYFTKRNAQPKKINAVGCLKY
ncbi:helix-turn-helix domain-containing protein, partial [Ruminococcus sp.]|uniref:helix-turn-helix domain-containing protein n=1 Tax=Ruminococcus sp. TaxID=41978 RepID=UPI003077D36D